MAPPISFFHEIHVFKKGLNLFCPHRMGICPGHLEIPLQPAKQVDLHRQIYVEEGADGSIITQ